MEWLIAPDRILDPSRYFVIIVNMFGSRVSSSPSNSVPPIDRGRYPNVTLTDNVRMQHRLVKEVFGVEKIALAFGYSMGAQRSKASRRTNSTANAWVRSSIRSATLGTAPRTLKM
jgi:homoserine O-acetyltransferase